MICIKELAEKIYKKARADGTVASSIIAVVDFTKPSSIKRMQIIEMNEGKVLLDTWVTHGSGSGGIKCTIFSNVNGSHKSSLGVFKTDETYNGKHGRSLRIDGLEKGFNDNARTRAIVIHGANYIGNGKTGRSFGCFAVPTDVKDKVIDLLKKGHLLIAYYPDDKWLKHSTFIENK